MALTKLSTDVIDLSNNTGALTIPSGTTGPNTTDTTGDCSYPTSALALYQLDNVTETCGNWSNATNVGSATFTPGKFGDALTLTGGQYLTLSDDWTYNNNFSCSVWVYMDSIAMNGNYPSPIYFFSTGSYDWNIELDNAVASPVFNLFCNASTGSQRAGTTTTLAINTWYHIAVTASSAEGKKIYLNGVLQTTNTDTSNLINYWNLDNRIGSSRSSDWDGKIDQLRLFTSVLTQADVTKLYNETNVTTTSARPTSPTEGLLRDNITTGALEFYNGSLWQQISGTLVPEFDTLSHFNTLIYPGNGGTKNVTGVGFPPGLTVIKAMNAGAYGSGRPGWYDTVRGGGAKLYSSINNAYTDVPYDKTLTAFGTDGFTVIDNSNGDYSVNGGAGGDYSGTPPDYVSWNWKAGGTAVLNENGTDIDSQVSANIAAGFSIVSYTTQSSGTATVGHGLSSPPDMIIVKTTGVADSWRVYNSSLGAGKQIFLNATSAASNTANQWNNTSPTNSVFSLGTDNIGSYTTIAYCWHSVAGYSKISSYVGNAGTQNIDMGFKPAWIMLKSTTSGAGNSYWTVFDNKRNPSNPRTCEIYMNSDDKEYCTTGSSPNYRGLNFTDTGIELLSTSYNNEASITFIYMAFA